MTLPDAFLEASPVTQALYGTLFTWALTAAGAALVFLVRAESRRLLDSMLGFTGGVMIAASFWSLLAPAIALAEEGPLPAWLPAAMGFMGGAAFLWAADRLLPHVHPRMRTEDAEGLSTGWRRTTLLVLAITLHNIPEGLAVGVAFGAAALGTGDATLGAAIALAIGIGIQNFPEGLAVSMPLRREGFSKARSFWWGQISGMVEPIAGVVGAAAVVFWQPVLPYALAFAAGAMIFVVIEEVIPEAQTSGNEDIVTVSAIVGFTVMMVLDVALG